MKSHQLIGFCLVAIFLVAPLADCFSQQAIVADSLSKQGLPFATIKTNNPRISQVTGINGSFNLPIKENITTITVSYAGYATRVLNLSQIKNRDTIFLSPVVASLTEVVIRPDREKIRRIINTAIENKKKHNPDLYELYECDIYYKMHTDLLPSPEPDSNKRKIHRPDTAFSLLKGDNHLLFSEVYSRRNYRRPQQLQETIIASRFSGLKKTYFTNLVTDVLPFHIYSDYITLNSKDYTNPLSRGWQYRYNFRLLDELVDENDTTFILSYEPKKNSSFNSLTGQIFISSKGYAVSHFTGLANEGAGDRQVKIEQIYQFISGKWFPRELNYDLIFKKYPLPELGLHLNGHSIIDSVSFTKSPDFRIDKTYPVKLGDSVDLYTEKDWENLRTDSITIREKNTYRIIDSISEKAKLESIIEKAGSFARGMLPIGKLDLDIKRLLARNDLENLRLGAGLYTNDRFSKYFSMGGWAGYGFKDKRMKYGMSATVFPDKNKDRWIGISYNRQYQSQGNYNLHPDLDRTGFRNWILIQVDEVEELAVKAHTQWGYWEIEVEGLQKNYRAKFPVNFEYKGAILNRFKSNETGINLRYAFGERRIPAFGYYLPTVTKYPILYLRTAIGSIREADYNTNYLRTIAALSFRKHINRWGNDNFRVEAGFIRSLNQKALPRSFLLAGSGFRNSGVNYYAWGGFLTMRPYDFYHENYFSFLYRHDFDWYLWKTKYSKPFISIAHNLLYGSLNERDLIANPGIRAAVSGFHESGILLNQLIQLNIAHAINLYLNAGMFYHWDAGVSASENAVWVFGISAGL